MSQFSAAGVAPNGTPVRLLFGWDHAMGLWADVYDPSLSQDEPFVEYYHATPEQLEAVLAKYNVNPAKATPEGIDLWPQFEREHWEQLK